MGILGGWVLIRSATWYLEDGAHFLFFEEADFKVWSNVIQFLYLSAFFFWPRPAVRKKLNKKTKKDGYATSRPEYTQKKGAAQHQGTKWPKYQKANYIILLFTFQ